MRHEVDFFMVILYLFYVSGIKYRYRFIDWVIIFYNIPMQRCNLNGKVVFSKYLVGSCIGFGSFGDVYLVYDIEAEQICAMKSQEQKSKNPQLVNEARIIKELSGQRGFVKFHHFGYESKCNIVVMGLLGPSLEDLFNSCNRSFSMKTILMLADQLLSRLETLHTKNYVYRDIKPQNFLMGLHENSHVVHIVDFGLSKRYRDIKNHQHIPYKQNRAIVGTVRYCSVNSHLGIQYSRRDDLESLGYVLQYFYKGNLPWQGIHANSNTEKYSKILEQKQNISVQQQFMDMPVEFSTYMNYCKCLKFSERPDYTFLKKLFSDLMDKFGYKRDYIFDWCAMEHTVKFQNGTMSLAIKNKYLDLESPYLTFMSADIDKHINQQDINLQLQNLNQVKEEQKQTVIVEDSEEGNIDPMILQDSDLKLISHRSNWYDNEL